MAHLMQNFVCPSKLIALFFILGAILIFVRSWRKAGRTLLVATGVLYLVFGSGPVAFWLLGNLEYQYKPINAIRGAENIDWIVTLAGHAESNPEIPLSSQVNSASGFRIMEAETLFRQIPNSQILISGYGDVPRIMQDLAISLGIPAENIRIDNGSNNTYESGLNLQKTLGKLRFVLVTSAGHMPRAMRAFRKLGMSPVPAPTDYRTNSNFLAIDYLPSPKHLEYSDLAVHEYLGILWYRLRGYI